MTGETTPWAGEARRGGCSPCSERAQHSEACLLLCESVCAMYVVYWCIPLRCELALSLTLSLSLSLCSCCRLTSYFVTHHDPRAVAAYAFSYGPDDGSVARRRVHTPLAYIAADTHRHIHIDTHRERERERETQTQTCTQTCTQTYTQTYTQTRRQAPRQQSYREACIVEPDVGCSEWTFVSFCFCTGFHIVFTVLCRFRTDLWCSRTFEICPWMMWRQTCCCNMTLVGASVCDCDCVCGCMWVSAGVCGCMCMCICGCMWMVRRGCFVAVL